MTKYIPTDREKEFIGNLINIAPNDTEYLYFSDMNINNINKNIISEIQNITYERYGKKIKIQPQNKNILITIMRHIYFRNIRELTNSESSHIRVDELNNRVYKEIIPTILNGLLSQIRYINDYNNISVSELPQSSHSKKNDNIRPLDSMFM